MVRHSMTSLKLQNKGNFLKERRKRVKFDLVYLDNEKSF